MSRARAQPFVLLIVIASCGRAVGQGAAPHTDPPPPKVTAREQPAHDAGADARAPSCVRPPPDALCEWAPECNRFSERLNGPDGKGFWSGFSTVCSCKKVEETTVTAELVIRELGRDWSIVTAECEGHTEPTSFLRETTPFAMPSLAARPSQVRPSSAYFDLYVGALAAGRKSANYTFAVHQRTVLAGLRGARWVRFANALADGGTTQITDYVVGFLPSGHLAGFYTDAERW